MLSGMISKYWLRVHIALVPLYIMSMFHLLVYHQPISPTTIASASTRTAFTTALRAAKQTTIKRTFTAASANAIVVPKMKFLPRPSQERGHADHGWLKTFHTFSFASYQDMDHEKFGSLRVINEDRVAAKKGFGTHPHREFEIWSYVVDGTLEHKDSMGNTEILRRGDIQLTSAGTGIAHSEHAAPASNAPVHILQIWAVPAQRGLPPTYYTRHFGDAQKTNKWVRLVAPVGEAGVLDAREGGGPVPVHSGVRMWGSILEQGKKPGVEGEGGEGGVPLKGAKAYVHVVQTSGYNPGKAEGAQVKVTGGGEELVMREGDGVYVWTEGPGRLIVENTGDRKAEVLVFDLD